MTLPLSGVKVLDFSWAIVGGTSTKLLGDFGAEVVKVESAKRMSLERLVPTVSVSRPDDPDDKPWFAHVNTSKESLRLDLSNPASRPIVDALIDWADVVVENFSPGTMDKLGLGYEALKARRPDIIMASGSVYGQTGPFAREWGIDGTGAALSGRQFQHGWHDRTPTLPAAPYGDCVLPYFLATAIVAAIDHRDRTGEGCRIDGAMFEVQVQQMAPATLAGLAGSPAMRRGNREPDAAPHGVFPCAGKDRWIAIAAYDEAQWRALCEALDAPGLCGFGDYASRKANEDALEAEIAALTALEDAHDLMARLQARGVPAGVVQQASEVLERDPQMAFRGAFQTLDHARLGAFPHQASPVALSETPARMRPAPRFGEHTREICARILGMDESAIAAAEAAGALN